MLSSAQNIAPKPAASLPPAVQASQPANTAGNAPSFAQFLNEQPSLPTPPAHTEPEPSPPEAAPPAAPSPRRATAQPAKPAAQKPAGEASAKAEAKADAKADGTGKADADKSADAVSDGSDDDDTPDTSKLKEFTQLIGMNAAQPDAAAAAAKPELHRGRAAAAASGADDDATQGRTALQATGDKGRARDKPEVAAAKPGDVQADKAAAKAASEPLQATATKQSADLPAVAATPTQATPSFAATLAQALPSPTATPDAAPTTTYSSVQAPVNGSAFAPELGARVSLLAVDGVQQAELQLNPADMGPVAVQITVDGSQAQVSFHAAQAETRQALEQSLPDLAAALQGQGLTLSGGGVFQQAQRDVDHGEQQSGNGGTTRSSRDSSSRVDGATASAVPAARRSVGLLDTFA